MRCLSSIAALNLLVATLSWSFLSLLKKSYHTPIASRIQSQTKMITAGLQIVHHLILADRFAIHICTYPLCLLVASAAVDLAVSMSMTSSIASSSPN
jgi:hypothetical protein